MKTLSSSRLKDLTLKIGSGATPTGGEKSYKDNGITLIRSLNVYDFIFQHDGLAFIDDTQAAQLSNVEVARRDILLNITGASVARCCMVPDAVLPARVNQHVAIVRIDPRKGDARYVLYCINSPRHKARLLSIAQGGATREALTKQKIEEFEIPTPSLPTQRKIAAILSAYDDLIENNTRRIAILEAMAQTIYREWFVEFRFPGHEKVKLVDSPLGKIPDGWRWAKLKDACDSVNYGFTASANKTSEVGPKFLRITDIVPQTIDWDNVPYCEVEPDDADKYALFEGDIVIARTGATTGYAKRLNKRHPKSVFASYLVRIHPSNALGKHYIGVIVESAEYKEFIKRNLGGAAQPQANAQVLTSLDVLVPSSHVIQAFDGLLEPLADQKEIMQVKNRILRKTRDLLLPKLISGQMDVEELDIEAGEEVTMTE